MSLRQALETDIPAMHKVRLSVRENKLSPTTRIAENDYLDAITTLGRGWVIDIDGLIVAFAVGYKLDGNIWALFVHPEYERRGYGSELHSVMTDWLWQQGLKRLWLTTSPKTRAESFYTRLGWLNRGLTSKGEIYFELCKP